MINHKLKNRIAGWLMTAVMLCWGGMHISALAQEVESPRYMILTTDIESLDFADVSSFKTSAQKVLANFIDSASLAALTMYLDAPHSENGNMARTSGDSRAAEIVANYHRRKHRADFDESAFKQDVMFHLGEQAGIGFEVGRLKLQGDDSQSRQFVPDTSLSALAQPRLSAIGDAFDAADLDISSGGFDTLFGGNFWLTTGISLGAGFVLALAVNGDEETSVQTDTAPMVFFQIPPGNYNHGMQTPGLAAPEADFQMAEYNSQYGLSSIRASSIYAKGYDGNGVTVSVMDSVFDTGHSDLSGAFDGGYNAFTGASGTAAVDCRANGGACAASHGTHVAGIIAARKNDTGMHGVAFGARIKPVAIFNDAGMSTNTSETVMAIRQASGNGIVAMNNSWGRIKWVMRGGFYYETVARGNLSLAENNAWRDAVNAGTVIVFANGNEGHNSVNGRIALYNSNSSDPVANPIVGYANWTGPDMPTLEGRLPLDVPDLASKWLTVVAVDTSNVITDFSNGCGEARNWCVAAPGRHIFSTVPGSTRTRSGTSMAAPHVTGAIALLKQMYPNLNAEQLVGLLVNTTTDLGAPGIDSVYGRGLINLERASEPQGIITAVSVNNQPLAGDDARFDIASMQLSSLFGDAPAGGLRLGVTDDYDRAFVVSPYQQPHAPVSFTAGDYLTHFDAPKMRQAGLGKNTVLRFAEQDEGESSVSRLQFQHHSDTYLLRISADAAYRDIGLPLAGEAHTDAVHLNFRKIRPLAADLMQIRHEIQTGKNFGISHDAAAGKFDNGNRFDELGMTLHYRTRTGGMSFGIGQLREHDQFLGATATGAYGLSGAAHSQTAAFVLESYLTPFLAMRFYHSHMRTDVDFQYDRFVNIDNLKANDSAVTLTAHRLMRIGDSLSFDAALPLTVTNGTLTQHTTQGYTENGSYNSVTQHYALKPDRRWQRIGMIYQTPVGKNSRLFAVWQTHRHWHNQPYRDGFELITGIKTRF